VLDIERYPAFVPGCRAVKVYSRAAAPAGRTVIVSRMTVGVAGFDVSYANLTTGDAVARRIEVKALDGAAAPARRAVDFRARRRGVDERRFFRRLRLRQRDPLGGRRARVRRGEIHAAFERRADRLFTRTGKRG
jgi:coenzyme Q-binding protein COQ10